MRFVFLIHHDEKEIEKLGGEELTRECAAYDADLELTGNLILAHALQPAKTGRSVRRRRKVQITDGPYAETKEQIIGLLVIEASDADEAARIAARSPLARTGTIEMRRAFDIRGGTD